MKIELEESDINYINRVNEDLDARLNSIPLLCNEINKNYNINFTCLDRAKANSFILGLCSPHMAKEIEEKFGIRINSINYCHGDNKLTELKDYLQTFLNELEQI